MLTEEDPRLALLELVRDPVLLLLDLELVLSKEFDLADSSTGHERSHYDPLTEPRPPGGQLHLQVRTSQVERQERPEVSQLQLLLFVRPTRRYPEHFPAPLASDTFQSSPSSLFRTVATVSLRTHPSSVPSGTPVTKLGTMAMSFP